MLAKHNSAQQRLYDRIALGGFALSVILVLVALIAGPEFIFGGFAVMAVTGTLYTEGRNANVGDAVHRVPSVSDVLTLIEPARFPFTQFLFRVGKNKKPKQVVHQWGEISTLPRQDTVNGATTAGGAGAAKTVTVDNGGYWRPNDTFISLTNATDTTAENIYWISAVSGNDLTVYVLPVSTASTPYSGDSFGTVPAFADAEVLYWTGNTLSEADDASPSRIIQPAYKFNFVQTLDAVIKYSDHKMRSENFGPDDVRRYKRDSIRELRKSLEYAFVFNKAPSVTTDPNNNELRHTMGGAFHYVAQSSVSLANTGGVPTESQAVDFVYACFDDNNGSDTKLLMGGKNLMKAIDKVNTGDLFTRRSEKKAGVMVNVLESRIGELVTAYHPGFDETGRPSAGLCLDMAHISKRDLQPLERRVLELKRSSSGTDAEAEQWIIKTTLEMRNADTHKEVALA